MVVRLDLRTRRRLEKLARALDLLAREREIDVPFGDRRDLLRRNVLRLGEGRRRDREAVEDVRIVVPGDLVDPADLRAVDGVDLPAGPDHQPGNGLVHGPDLARTRPGWTSTLRAHAEPLGREPRRAA